MKWTQGTLKQINNDQTDKKEAKKMKSCNFLVNIEVLSVL